MCAEIPMLRIYLRSNSDVTSAGDESSELVDSALKEFTVKSISHTTWTWSFHFIITFLAFSS